MMTLYDAAHQPVATQPVILIGAFVVLGPLVAWQIRRIQRRRFGRIHPLTGPLMALWIGLAIGMTGLVAWSAFADHESVHEALARGTTCVAIGPITAWSFGHDGSHFTVGGRRFRLSWSTQGDAVGALEARLRTLPAGAPVRVTYQLTDGLNERPLRIETLDLPSLAPSPSPAR